MTHSQAMLETHPRTFNLDASMLAEAIDALMDCANTCTQCAEAWCLHACPVEAIKVDAATGAKVVLNDVCVGCKVCTIAVSAY